VTSAFVYLAACAARNRIRQRLRRLRQPRYLIGFAAGGLYLYFFFFRHAFGGASSRGPTPFGGVENAADSLAFIGPLLLWLIVTMAWVTPGSGPAIPFTRSEVQFLFAAPLSRRQLLNYKLLRGQLGPLLGTAVTTVFLRPSSAAKGWMFFGGMWMVLAVLRMHLLGVALRRQSLGQHGAQGARRHWLPIAIVGGAALVVLGTIALDWPQLSAMETRREVFDELKSLFSTGPPRWILWPFAAVAHLPLAASPGAFGQALPMVAVILALNYFWVVRGDVAFEEASAAHAEQQAEDGKKDAAVIRDVRRTPFPLSLSGRPEIALLWKNLILCGRFATWRIFVRFVPVVIVVSFVIARASSSGLVEVVLFVSLAAAMMVVLIGPQSLRSDLRQDLVHFQLLKCWPVRGAVLLRGELLAPAVVLTVTTWLLILTAAIFTWPEAGSLVLPPDLRHHRLAFAFALALVAPALIVAQLVLHNGIAVLFPAWVAIGTTRARGIDAMGQRLLMMAGVVIVLLIAVIPASLIAAPVVLAIEMSTGHHGFAVVTAAVIMATVILGESWLALGQLGRAFEKTDATDLEPVE
jgi:hypothetical protein